MNKLVFILAVIACATCQSPAPPTGLTIQSLTKVMRASDPSGRNHSTKVIIAPHDAFRNIVQWQLELGQTETDNFVTYNLTVDGKDPTTKKEFIFEGNLVESDILRFRAINSSNNIVARTTMTLKIQDLGSNVAWVGAERNSDMASLRVNASSFFPAIMIDRRVCKLESSPCYYIMPKPLPILGERCINVDTSKGDVKMCDERVTSFKEMSSTPKLSLPEDGKMLVEMTHDISYKKIEVVIFDPEDRTHVYSKNGSACLIDVNTHSNTGGKVQCHHKFTQPKGQTKMMVLVVRLDDNGVVHESRLLHFDAMPSEDKDMTGVIVGSVIGTLIGLALIILLVLFFIKKKDKKSTKSGSEAQYSAAKTEETDP